MKKLYTATATKVETYWHIDVPQVRSVTQARSLEKAEEMARDLITLLTGQDPETFEVQITP